MEFVEKFVVDIGYIIMKFYMNEVMMENIDIYGRKGYVEMYWGVE